ncbi:MAG: phosphate ABC transporter substrate-binding protein PstS [Xanthomonadales bacterium]|nr:phosphate ABC transporter substrate-binding protein PstS [Xanthomonadales bacterium]
MNANTLRSLIAAAAMVLASGQAAAVDITGAGSSFVYPVISRWAAAHAEASGTRVNYQSIGSGGGIAQIKAGTVDFGASDIPLDDADLDAAGLGQFPDVIGGIVPAFNVAGIEPGALVLDGPVLAGIFLGEVQRWNAPAIIALNPDLSLPDAAITVVHRSDGSGTTYNFTDYLARVSPDWKSKVGTGASVKWPTGVGGKGNEGIAAYVRQLPNSIGYVEYAYAVQNKLGYARMKNAAGRVVAPQAASFEAAAASADWAGARNFNLLMTNAPGEDAWPITATSWVIVHRQPKHAARAKATLDFFRWAFEHGREQALALDYVPLPPTLVRRIEAYWDAGLKH